MLCIDHLLEAPGNGMVQRQGVFFVVALFSVNEDRLPLAIFELGRDHQVRDLTLLVQVLDQRDEMTADQDHVRGLALLMHVVGEQFLAWKLMDAEL